jgi:hypothetical protein
MACKVPLRFLKYKGGSHGLQYADATGNQPGRKCAMARLHVSAASIGKGQDPTFYLYASVVEDGGSPVTGLTTGNFKLLFITRTKLSNPVQFQPAAEWLSLKGVVEALQKTGLYQLEVDWSKLHALTSDLVFAIVVRRQQGEDKLSSDHGQTVVSYHSPFA